MNNQFSSGTRILSLSDIPKEQMYRIRLKGTMICFNMLRGIFSGSYVNFGVFRLYGDRCLEDVLAMFVKLLLVIPQADLLVFTSLS